MLIQKQFVGQIEFVGQLKKLDDNDNATDAWDKNQSMLFSNFRKIARNEMKWKKRNERKKETKFSQGRAKVL